MSGRALPKRKDGKTGSYVGRRKRESKKVLKTGGEQHGQDGESEGWRRREKLKVHKDGRLYNDHLRDGYVAGKLKIARQNKAIDALKKVHFNKNAIHHMGEEREKEDRKHNGSRG